MDVFGSILGLGEGAQDFAPSTNRTFSRTASGDWLS
jgi:hypothetical protein